MCVCVYKYIYIKSQQTEYKTSSPASPYSTHAHFKGFLLFFFHFLISSSYSLLAAQAPGDPSYEEPAEEDWGPRSCHGGGTYLGQQVHGAQHRGAGAAVGPAWPAGDENAAQPGAADPSSVLPTLRAACLAWVGDKQGDASVCLEMGIVWQRWASAVFWLVCGSLESCLSISTTSRLFQRDEVSSLWSGSCWPLATMSCRSWFIRLGCDDVMFCLLTCPHLLMQLAGLGPQQSSAVQEPFTSFASSFAETRLESLRRPWRSSAWCSSEWQETRARGMLVRYFWHVDGPCSQDSLTALFAAPLLSAQFCAELLLSLPDGRRFRYARCRPGTAAATRGFPGHAHLWARQRRNQECQWIPDGNIVRFWCFLSKAKNLDFHFYVC